MYRIGGRCGKGDVEPVIGLKIGDHIRFVVYDLGGDVLVIIRKLEKSTSDVRMNRHGDISTIHDAPGIIRHPCHSTGKPIVHGGQSYVVVPCQRGPGNGRLGPAFQHRIRIRRIRRHHPVLVITCSILGSSAENTAEETLVTVHLCLGNILSVYSRLHHQVWVKFVRTTIDNGIHPPSGIVVI